MKTKTLLLLIVYLAVASVTYGYAYNQEHKELTKAFPQLPLSNRNDSMIEGFVSAVAWPIYWPFHISRIMWTKSLPEKAEAA